VVHSTNVQQGVTHAVPPSVIGVQPQAPPPQLNVSQLSGVPQVLPETVCAETDVVDPMIIGATYAAPPIASPFLIKDLRSTRWSEGAAL